MSRLLFAILLAFTPTSVAFAGDSVKVFILAGQSNMEGHGKVDAEPKANEGRGSLEWLVENPATAPKFKHLVDEHDQWISREDVQIWYLGRKGNLAPGFGFREGYIGPELGFGFVVGDRFEDPVLLIKLAWGGKSLAKDFRPPSSGGEVGPYYEELLQLTKEVLRDANSIFPQYADRPLELVGFGWHQGWNDRVNQAFNDEYEQNLANFIRDIRKDLHAHQPAIRDRRDRHERPRGKTPPRDILDESPSSRRQIRRVSGKRCLRGHSRFLSAKGSIAVRAGISLEQQRGDALSDRRRNGQRNGGIDLQTVEIGCDVKTLDATPRQSAFALAKWGGRDAADAIPRCRTRGDYPHAQNAACWAPCVGGDNRPIRYRRETDVPNGAGDVMS